MAFSTINKTPRRANGSSGPAASGRSAALGGANAAGRATTSGRAGAPKASRAHNQAKDPAPNREAQQAFLKYANDNAVVRWFYQLTTGPQRHLFYLVVGVLIAVGIYLPVRDFYIANRTAQILTEQKAIRDKYNDSIGREVKDYLSQEGVEDAARKDLGMVMPGEQTITVEGLDEDGNPIRVQEGTDPAASTNEGDAAEGGSTNGSAPADGQDPAAEDKDNDQDRPKSTTGAYGAQEEDDGRLKGEDAADKSKTGSALEDYDPSKEPTTSAEVEAAERAVFENSPWYWKFLDALFLFDGADGMAVVSTGDE